MELSFQQLSQPEKDVVNLHLVLQSFIPLTALILTNLIIFIGFSSIPSLSLFYCFAHINASSIEAGGRVNASNLTTALDKPPGKVVSLSFVLGANHTLCREHIWLKAHRSHCPCVQPQKNCISFAADLAPFPSTHLALS